MSRLRWLGIVIFAIAGMIAGRQAGRHIARQGRTAYYALLQPVAVTNCEMQRFGEPNDGGYLLCGNLLGGIQAGYSYGISGYDGWGCDVSTKFKVVVHEYDCFDTRQPACPNGSMKFHAECVGGKPQSEEGRSFDTVQNQIAKNGDSAKHIALKMDVEGAEWDSFLATPDEVFQSIDQLIVEFHGPGDDRNGAQEKKRRVIERLRGFFEIAHVHFNNATCDADVEPFPARVYEVLFVNKQLAVVDPSRQALRLHPLDARNLPDRADCQPKPL